MPATPIEGSAGSPPSRPGRTDDDDGKARRLIMRSDDSLSREEARSRRDPMAAWALAVAIIAMILAAVALTLAVGLVFLLPQQQSSAGTQSCCEPQAHQADDISAAIMQTSQGRSSSSEEGSRSSSSDSSDNSETASLMTLNPPALPSPPPPPSPFPFKSSSSSEDSERNSAGPAQPDLTSHPIADMSESDEESTTPIYYPHTPAAPSPRPSVTPPPAAPPPAPRDPAPVPINDPDNSSNDDSASESSAQNALNASEGHNLCPQSFDCRTPRGILGFMDGRCICQVGLPLTQS